MRANRSADTKPEIALRSALHRQGLRFRKNLTVRVDGRLATKPDVVFTRSRVAVFLDGCFWHRCPEHATSPTLNGEFWRAKLEANVERDRLVDRELAKSGWQVIRVWEHDDPDKAARRIATQLGERPSSGVQSRG
jgi:DNA mismatch endonuclease (patch repair protein)